jgi:hypothetical protein
MIWSKMNGRFGFSFAMGFAVVGLALDISTAAPPRIDPEVVIRRLDVNQDGVISPNEVPPRARVVFDRLAKQADENPHQAIRVEKLVRAARHLRSRRQGDGRKDGSGGASSGTSAVPGFGNDPSAPAVPGFGDGTVVAAVRLEDKYEQKVIDYVNRIFREYDKNDNDVLEKDSEWKRIEWRSDPNDSDLNNDGKLTKEEFCERLVKRWGSGRKSAPSRPANSSSSSSGGASSSAINSAAYGKVRSYAQSLLRQYDENKNGVLEKGEWSKMSGNPKASDTNNDDVLTLDEMTARLASYGKSSGSSGSGGGNSGWSRDSSSSAGEGYRTTGSKLTGKTSYRAKSPIERLPRGLPDWFARNDTNGNGQIEMREYSTTWSNTKAGEFLKYDLNRDGVITAEECLRAEEG